MEIELDTFNNYGQQEQQDLAAYRRWHEQVINAIGCNSLDALKQCYTPPWSLAGDIENVPVEDKLVPPLTDAVLRGTTHLGLIKFMMVELKQRLLLPHSGICRCNLCMALKNDATLRNQYIKKTLMCLSSPLYIFNRTSEEDAVQFCINTKQRILDFYATFQPKPDYDAGNMIMGHWEFSKALFRPMTSVVDIDNKYEHLKKVMENLDKAICMLLDKCSCDDEAMALLIAENKNSDTQYHSYTRMFRKNLRLYKFAKLDLTGSLIHPTSQSVLSVFWMNHWKYPTITANLNDPVVHGLCSYLGAPFMLLLAMFFYFILTPLTIIFPFPVINYFVKSPRSKYYNDIIGEFVFQLFLYVFLYSTPLFPYLSVKERICSQVINQELITPIHLGLSIIIFIFLIAKMIKFMERVIATAGRNVLPLSWDIFFWMEHVSHALLLAGFMLEFVWIANTKAAIDATQPKEILLCYCNHLQNSPGPFCNMNPLVCPLISNLNPLQNQLFIHTMGQLMYLSQISDTIIVGGIFFNLLALPFTLSYLHPWLFTITDRLRKCLRIFYTLFPIYTAILITFSGFIQLLNDNVKGCTSQPDSYFFSTLTETIWELMFTSFKVTNSVNSNSTMISGTNIWVVSIFQMTNNYIMLIHYVFLLITALFLFGCVQSLLTEVIRRQAISDIRGWMILHSRKKLAYMCRGCELAIPFNLLHPIYFVTSLAMRKTYKHFDVPTRDHGGIGEVFDILQTRSVPRYKETQTRCRSRILAEYMHEAPDYSYL